MQYVSSLISGVGIFCMGAGLSIYHGIVGLGSPQNLESLTLALVVLGGSFLSESVTLALAVKSTRCPRLHSTQSPKGAKLNGNRS